MKLRAMLLCGALSAATLPAADTLTEEFQRALFEEEANRNLPAAIAGYEAVIKRLDEQRQLAATAVFRMGESYRKLGKTNEAVSAYERIIKEFADQETLVKLSGQNLSVLRPKENASPASTDPELSRLIERRNQMLAKIQLMRTRYTDEHPGLQQATQDVQLLDSQIQQLMSGGSGQPTSSELTELRRLEILLETVRSLEPMGDAELRTLLEFANDDEAAQGLKAWRKLRTDLERHRSDLRNRPEDKTVVERVQFHERLVQDGEAWWSEWRAATLRMLEARVEAARRLAGQGSISPGGGTFGSSEADTRAGAARQEYLRLKSTLEELKKSTSREELKTLVQVLLPDANLGKLDEMEVAARTELAGHQAEFGPDHGAVKKSQAELHSIDKSIDERIAGAIKAAVIKLAALEQMLDIQPAGDSTTTGTSSSTMTAEEAEELRRVQAFAANSPDLLNRPSGEPSNFPLMWAARNGWVQVVDLLLRHGARTDILHEYRSPLSQAAEAGHLAVVERLVRAGADLNGPGDGSPTALWNAARLGYANIATTLLKAGANPDLPRDQNQRVNNPTQRGQFPIEGPLAVANVEISRHLLRHGALPDGPPGSEPPIVTAGGNAEKLELLLAHNAKPGVTNQNGETALHYATKAGNVANVRRLLALGLDPNARTVAGYSAMHFAATENHPEMIRLLAEHGAEVNALDPSGDTPLHFAAMRHTLDAARALVEAGADPEQKNKRGNPSRDYVWPFADAGAPYVWSAGAPLPHTRQPVYEVGYAREPGGPRFLPTYQPFMELLGGSTNTWRATMRNALPALPATDLEKTSDR